MKAVAPLCELLLVVGSQNSSNSQAAGGSLRESGRAGVSGGRSNAKCEPEWLRRRRNGRGHGRRFGAGVPGGGPDRVRCDEHGFDSWKRWKLKEEDVRFSLAGRADAASQLTHDRSRHESTASNS